MAVAVVRCGRRLRRAAARHHDGRQSGTLAAMVVPASCYFRGVIVWLTNDQGGRQSGPPTAPYAANAFVPPCSATAGLASFVVHGFTAGTWRSPAEGRWLAVENDGPYRVQVGTVVVVTEGPKPVGYFHVDEVRQLEQRAPLRAIHGP